jgi:hypothetical protein
MERFMKIALYCLLVVLSMSGAGRSQSNQGANAAALSDSGSPQTSGTQSATPAATPSGTPAKVPLPVDWKANPPDDTSDNISPTKRYPLLVGTNAAGYEFNLCTSLGQQRIEIVPKNNNCVAGGGYLGYGTISTTGFLEDAAYRVVMGKIGNYLEDLDKRIESLSNEVTSFENSVNVSLNKRFDALPQELANSEVIKKLRQDILDDVDKKLAAAKKADSGHSPPK